ncbi:putative GTP-binding protein EngB [Wallemia ichthyophaga EXF-994]|uniref:Putative GTP-binding protein EngB n=1 Tax=Wallemia ichthyophaga (strain EXF-994 / CBS 113033) TaxID=1299270 RepID=R9ABH3_WALI9|nr:putative GTP-binding protein EngB [Wallemia ichthyophaga EXF-994]EOQ99477.1 putative GTP-binding protein EngB [Wallemia ichthyophaga EXF-994]
MATKKQLENMFTTNVKQMNWKSMQKSKSPEMLFVGRSNVGKSSLLNSLLSTKDMVKTSRHAGQTKHLNYFSLNGKFTLVDAPGYGGMGRDSWGGIVEEYIETRSNLNRVVVLINAMHGLLDSDHYFLNYLNKQREEYGVRWLYQLAFTKSDMVPKPVLEEYVGNVEMELCRRYPTLTPPIHMVSIKDPLSIFKLRRGLLE